MWMDWSPWSARRRNPWQARHVEVMPAGRCIQRGYTFVRLLAGTGDDFSLGVDDNTDIRTWQDWFGTLVSSEFPSISWAIPCERGATLSRHPTLRCRDSNPVLVHLGSAHWFQGKPFAIALDPTKARIAEMSCGKDRACVGQPVQEAGPGFDGQAWIEIENIGHIRFRQLQRGRTGSRRPG